jgi:hypothetical protein
LLPEFSFYAGYDGKHKGRMGEKRSFLLLQ